MSFTLRSLYPYCKNFRFPSYRTFLGARVSVQDWQDKTISYICRKANHVLSILQPVTYSIYQLSYPSFCITPVPTWRILASYMPVTSTRTLLHVVVILAKLAVYYNNTEVRSHKSLCRENTTMFAYSVCVSVTLVIEYAIRMRRILLSFVTCPTLP
jgi:hypothetical protein